MVQHPQQGASIQRPRALRVNVRYRPWSFNVIVLISAVSSSHVIHAVRVAVSNAISSPGRIGAPVRLQRPGYFARIIFIMFSPLECCAVCERFGYLAVALQLVDIVNKGTTGIDRENQLGRFIGPAPTVAIPAAR